MARPLTQPEKLIFGEDAELHPLTDLPLQRGYGAASADEQAIGHLEDVLEIQRDQALRRLDDIDREIGDLETDQAKIPTLERRRVATRIEIDQLGGRIREVTAALLLSGAVERVRGRVAAETLRARLRGATVVRAL